MRTLSLLTPGLLAIAMFNADKLTERKLDNVAVISLPKSIKEEMYKGLRTDQAGRVLFTFNTSYFWASFGSSTAYRQLVFISIMDPQSSDADYSEFPNAFRLRYEKRKVIRSSGSGTSKLEVSEGVYEQNSLQEPSHIFHYTDKSRHLQIVWHAVKKDVSLNDGLQLMEQIAASFRLIQAPAASFAEQRDRPRVQADERTRKRTLAIEMLAREGFPNLEPGKPVLRDGIYLEWTTDPEPRYQLLFPLGDVKARANVMGGQRPRPTSLRNADNTVRELPGSVGWYDYWEDEWGFHNYDNAYLPFSGVGRLLAAKHKDAARVFFYYSATVRVEEAEDNLLTSLKWFRQSIPEVQQLWRDGKLVKGFMDEAPFPIRPSDPTQP